MANIRAEIEQRLRIAEEDGDYVDAEAYSAWLALDAAPVGESPSQMGTVLVVRVPDGVHLKGQRIRLVPTHAAGGE